MGIVAVVLLCAHPARARLTVDLDNPAFGKMYIAIPEFVAEGQSNLSGRALAEILKNDLMMTGLFHIVELPPGMPPEPPGKPDFAKWRDLGAQALVEGSFRVTGGNLVLEARLYDVSLRKQELGKRFTATEKAHRQVVHKLGDRILERFTGTPGSFTSKIVFVGSEQRRELYMMDYDGHNLVRLTANNSINLSPRLSRARSAVLFTSYMKGKPDLWEFDLRSGRTRLISSRPGINASGEYSPDGRKIAVSLSHKGIPKIFLITPQGNIVNRLTNGRGNDISPAWSPDGSRIAFVSDQAGAPQIYLMPVNGGPPQRLTFESGYNTDPDWSSRGDTIVFTARIEGRFQICTIKTDGTDFRVLTSVGSNTDPVWSPDGRMIAFTSKRGGGSRIYVMDAFGEMKTPVSPIPGKAPSWGRLNP